MTNPSLPGKPERVIDHFLSESFCKKKDGILIAPKSSITISPAMVIKFRLKVKKKGHLPSEKYAKKEHSGYATTGWRGF